MLCHAGGRGVDEAARARESGAEVGRGTNAVAGEMGVEPRGEGGSACGILIKDQELGSTEPEHGIAAGRAGPAGADEDHALEVRVGQRAAKTPAPAGPVGVVADEAV